jgi:hypothetical protein
VLEIRLVLDQRGALPPGAGERESVREQLEVVRVADPGHVATMGKQAGGNVLGEGKRSVALDRDVVVVVDPAEVGESHRRPASR